MKLLAGTATFFVFLMISLIIVVNHDIPDGAAVKTTGKSGKSAFADFYYYDPDRAARYEAYEATNPSFSPAEVVWRVGVNLDKPFYTDVVEIGDPGTIPMLVNKHYKLPDDFVPQKLVSLEGEKEISLAAQEAYKSMRNDAADENLEFGAASGYRSIKDQKKLYDKYVKEENGDTAMVDSYCARAGQSEHNTGLAIDLIGPNGDMEAFGETEESTWVDANAYKYGFIVRYSEKNSLVTGYKPEPWHITYVGTDVAQAMHDQNISSLEEYFVKFIWYNPAG